MRYANIENNKIEASKDIKEATCPCCGDYVTAKCGDIRAWHFSHKSKSDCIYKPMTDWHYDWQNNFNKDFLEIIQIDDKTGEKHIADVKNSNGVVIEFQHSPISISEIESRESFYENMIWVLDGSYYEAKPMNENQIFNIDISKNEILQIYNVFSDWFSSKNIKSLDDFLKLIGLSKKCSGKDLIKSSKRIDNFKKPVFIDNGSDELIFLLGTDFLITRFLSGDFKISKEKILPIARYPNKPIDLGAGVLGYLYYPEIAIDTYPSVIPFIKIKKSDFIAKYNV